MKKALLGLRGTPVESYFMKANAPDGSRALWIRNTIFRQPGMPVVAEAWAIAFDREHGHVAIKSTVPYDTPRLDVAPQARFAKDALDTEVDGCFLSLSRTRGALTSGRGALEWRLDFGPPLAADIQHMPAPVTRLVTPISDARAEGRIVVARSANRAETEIWDVAGWPMMIGHNWGTSHPELYAWAHCNTWHIDGKPAPELVFEATSARLRMGPLLSPMATLVFLRWRGQSFDLSSPAALAKNRGHVSLRRWEVTHAAKGLELACDIAAETDDVVGLHYPNPVGPMTYCFNTKLARARLDLKLPDGTAFTALARAAALEIGTLEPDQSIKMVL